MPLAAVHATEQGNVWATAIATRPSDGHRIVYRYQSDFAPGFERARFPDRVVIAWAYDSDSGMPSKPEREAMDRLEDLLAPYVEQPALSNLALVSTGEGLREWTYYTRSQDEFMAKLNEALARLPRFPIEIDLAKDPRWERYDAFRSTLRK